MMIVRLLKWIRVTVAIVAGARGPLVCLCLACQTARRLDRVGRSVPSQSNGVLPAADARLRRARAWRAVRIVAACLLVARIQFHSRIVAVHGPGPPGRRRSGRRGIRPAYRAGCARTPPPRRPRRRRPAGGGIFSDPVQRGAIPARHPRGRSVGGAAAETLLDRGSTGDDGRAIPFELHVALDGALAEDGPRIQRDPARPS